MATTTVSNYIHSRIVTSIIDNSIVEESVTVPVNFVLFQPYFSDEGEDGHVIQWEYETDFTKKNGTPNLARHGQQIYNALQWLKGGGKVLGLRLTATDAKPAFAVLNIRTKEVDISLPDTANTEDEDAVVTVKGLKISPTFTEVPASLLSETILSLSESLQMKQVLNSVKSSSAVPSTTGWTNHFITVFKAMGKGKYGNNLGIFFQLDQTREEDLEDSRRYFYSVYKKDSKGNIQQQVSAKSLSLNPDAVDSTGTVSEFLDTVLKSSDYQKLYTGISAYTSETDYEDLIELFGKYTGAVKSTADTSVILSEAQDANFIDFLSLIDRTGSSYKRFIPADTTDATAFATANDTADVDFSQVAFLMGGTDGNLDISNYEYGPGKQYATKRAAEDAIKEIRDGLMYDAYAGRIDANILSPYKYQISAVIDANNGSDVKKQMVYLCRNRNDIVAYLDCNFSASVDAAINFKKVYLTGFTDWNASVWPQSGVAYDGYNLKNIDVTYCYDVAYKLPYLRNNTGPNRLMAGTTKGLVATMNSLNWYPDEDQKTDLLKNQMNYVEEVRLNQYAIMSSRTMYEKRLSYLAVLRNAHCICEAVYVGRQILTDLRFEEDPKIAMTKAKEQITRNLSYLITNGPVERLTVVATQSQQEAYENAARVTIEMKFTDFIQTWYFDVVAAR